MEIMGTPVEIADCIQRDLGLCVGIAYAEKINHLAYQLAADILRTRLAELKASCDAGSRDMGVLL